MEKLYWQPIMCAVVAPAWLHEAADGGQCGFGDITYAKSQRGWEVSSGGEEEGGRGSTWKIKSCT